MPSDTSQKGFPMSSMHLPAGDENVESRDDLAAVARLVRRAAAGESRAWDELVARFTPRMRAAARGFRLSRTDVDDVVQAAWLAAFQHINRLEKPESIGSWLLVTVRRAALRSLQKNAREVVMDEPPTPSAPDAAGPANVVIEAERRIAVLAAVERLPVRHRPLVDPAVADAKTSYAELSARLGMPVGSIGPTRGRILARMRRDPRLVAAVAA
jgi:RNA polymerase sigma factor (sigma-70 family)